MYEDILDFNYEDEQQQQPALPYAGFWVRVAAAVVDGLIFIPLGIMSVYNTLSINSLVLELVMTVIYLGYKPFLEYHYGATLGKMAVKVQVIDLDGGPIDVQQSIVRNIPYLLAIALSRITTLAVQFRTDFSELDSLAEYNRLMEETGYPLLSTLINMFFVISCLVVAFRKDRQALHDMMAETYCIHA